MSFRVQMIGLKTILSKEMTRVFRIWSQTLLPPLITSALYFIIFGHVLGSRVGLIHGFSYKVFIMPGLVFMPMVMGAYANTSGTFFGAKMFYSIQELLVSPMSNNSILCGYMAAGMLRGLLVACIVVFVSSFFIHLQIYSVWVVLLYVILGTALFSLAGLVNAIYAKTFDQISVIPTFILTPLNYFGGVFYAITMLPPFWRHIAAVDPILYLMRGFRYGFLDIETGSLWVTTLISICIVVVLYLFCLRMISKGRGLRA